MTATIHPITAGRQASDDAPTYWDIVHDAAMIRLRHQYLREWSRKFAQDVMDYAAQSGDAYLVASASHFIEQLEKTR